MQSYVSGAFALSMFHVSQHTYCIVDMVTMSLCLQSDTNKAELSTAVRKALYASKICSYAQGLNIIRAKSISMGWNIEMGELTRIWKVNTC